MHCRAAISLLLLCAATPANAGVDAEALLQEGIIRAKVGRFEQAIKVLTRAARATKDPGTLGKIQLHLGLNHSVLGQQARARRAFTAALTHDPTLTLDPGQTKRSMLDLLQAVRLKLKGTLQVGAASPGATLELDGRPAGPLPAVKELPVGRHRVAVWSADRRQRYRVEVVVRLGQRATVSPLLKLVTGRLSVVTTPAGARVLVDGEDVGATPLRATVTAGLHRVVARKEGFADHDQQADVPADGMLELGATLKPAAARAPAAPASDGPGEVTKLAQEQTPKRRWLWTWVAAGGAIAVGAAGLGLGISLQLDMDEYRGLTYRDLARLGELEQGIPDKATATNVVLGVAGALAVTAAVLFYVEGWVLHEPAKPREQRATVTPVVGPTSGLMLTVPF